MNEETKPANLARRVADLERLSDTYKAAWSGYHPLADYMQQLSDADKLPVGVLGRHYGDIAVEHMRSQEARIADMEAQRDNTAAHITMIARQVGDEALQVDDIAVRVLALVAERDKLQHEYHTVRANAQARVDEALIRALSAEQARRDAQALAERYQADAAAAWVRYENANRLQVSLQMERAEMRTKHDELLVALHGIGKALGLAEGDRSPYSITCGVLERVNRLAEIEAQEPVAKIHTDGYWTARRGYDPLSDGKAFLSVYARPVPAQAVLDGCGACGDGCTKRGSCRLADESPEAAR